MAADRTDLHVDFAAPERGRVADRAEFLSAVDALPGLVEVRAAMRRAAPLAPGSVLLDAGCGLGLEARRLAEAHPGATVIGLDHDPEILAAAGSGTANLRWRHGDVTALDLPAASVDVVRTERVLIYVDDLAAAIASIAAVLRPGGLFVGFELDYGATILPPLGRPPELVRRLTGCLERALPQPWAGRLVPAECEAAGMTVLDVRPHSFVIDHAVWARIVGDTLRAAAADGRLAEPGLDDWLAELDRPDHPGGFRAVFGGVLTTARR